MPDVWLALRIESVDFLITNFRKTKSTKDAMQIVEAINHLYGSNNPSKQLDDLLSRFKGAVRKTLRYSENKQRSIISKLKP
jgi:hypothetical protein